MAESSNRPSVCYANGLLIQAESHSRPRHMTDRKLVFPDRPIGDVRSLGVKATTRGGVTLVAKSDCKAVVEKLLSGQFEFQGFEAFTIFSDDSVQPHLQWSCDWPKDSIPTEPKIMKLIHETPDDVTHFEFYFR